MPLKIEERVLHYLAGVSYLDRGLRNVLLRLSDKDDRTKTKTTITTRTTTLTPLSHQGIIEKILICCSNSRNNNYLTGKKINNDHPDPTADSTSLFISNESNKSSCRNFA
jgi:hypothetical protein